MPRKIALVLSGGGAKGAFQCGAERYARQVKGYHWDVIAGVSVGALNAAMLAMQKYDRLLEIWNTISNGRVYTGGFNLLTLIRLFFGAKSFYNNAPLWELLRQEFDPQAVRADLRVGAVSLITGEYIQFRRDEPYLARAILASTTMPIIWGPVDISPRLRNMVDGGVRNLSPLGDVLDSSPDEVVVINCGPEAVSMLAAAPKDIVQIGLRSLDIMSTELFQCDLREFLRINALVQEAAAYGLTLHNPKNGKPLKYYECKIIEPEIPLGETLDFSQAAVQNSLQAGYERARQVLG